MPKISFISWVAQDISDLVKTTQIKHPDNVTTPPKPNACLRPPNMKQTTLTHTFETIKKQPTPATITPNKNPNKTLDITQKITPLQPSMPKIFSLRSNQLNLRFSANVNHIWMTKSVN